MVSSLGETRITGSRMQIVMVEPPAGDYMSKIERGKSALPASAPTLPTP